MSVTDPIEKIIEDALDAAGISYVADGNGDTLGLDFKVGDIFIECKAYHTDRANEQLKRAPNVILIQGKEAALLFARLITTTNFKGDNSLVLRSLDVCNWTSVGRPYKLGEQD